MKFNNRYYDELEKTRTLEEKMNVLGTATVAEKRSGDRVTEVVLYNDNSNIMNGLVTVLQTGAEFWFMIHIICLLFFSLNAMIPRGANVAVGDVIFQSMVTALPYM